MADQPSPNALEFGFSIRGTADAVKAFIDEHLAKLGSVRIVCVIDQPDRVGWNVFTSGKDKPLGCVVATRSTDWRWDIVFSNTKIISAISAGGNIGENHAY